MAQNPNNACENFQSLLRMVNRAIETNPAWFGPRTSQAATVVPS